MYVARQVKEFGTDMQRFIVEMPAKALCYRLR